MLEKHDGNFRNYISRVRFVHTKYRYEIEIPNEMLRTADKKLEELVLTSQRSGYQRFHTEKIKQFLDSLEAKEDNLRDSIMPFVCAIF